ncbi:MAG: hypothetical protein JO020_24985 [Chloroflexi bacterium]|nr:hypothetical protein [Chloroflexota bacterium]
MSQLETDTEPGTSAAAPSPHTRRARVTSHSPGRLRVRLARGADQPHVLQSVKRHMEDRVGVGRVEVSHTTNSVLVHYDRHRHSFDDVLAMLRDVGVVVSQTAKALSEEDLGPAPETSTTSAGIVSAVSDLDRRLAQMTGYQVDLRTIFPLTLGALGVLQLARRGVGLGDVPAYVLIWYAFDSFWKFHSHAEPNR